MTENHGTTLKQFDARVLSGVGVLAAVIECGSFASAGETLGLSPSGVSRAVARLENRLGIRLFDRTTRALRLTGDGAQFFSHVQEHLEAIADAVSTVSGAASAVHGRLRVNVDSFFAGFVLAPHLPRFAERYPDVLLELHIRDGLGDLIAEGMDVALRFGPQPSSSLVARKLLETRILTVAAPAYLARHGRPSQPEDLVQHECIQFRDPLTTRPFNWEFHRGGDVVHVATEGALLVTDVNTMLQSCIAGAGVAQVMALGVQGLIATGALVELFPDWPDETFPLYAIHPSQRNQPARVRAFVDFCAELAKAAKA